MNIWLRNLHAQHFEKTDNFGIFGILSEQALKANWTQTQNECIAQYEEIQPLFGHPQITSIYWTSIF